MSWSIGYDDHWKRDIGYGVPAVCDHPDCNGEIDRGLSHVCGDEPYGGENGCGLYFCGLHRECLEVQGTTGKLVLVNLCDRCRVRWSQILDDNFEGVPQEPYEAKPDVREWVEFKLADESWLQWRQENATDVELLRECLKEGVGA